MFWIALFVFAGFAGWLLIQSKNKREQRDHFERMANSMLAREKVEMRVPDVAFAARGFKQVAITRRYAPNTDLHKLERGYAEQLLQEGCSRGQALSARWGGAYAITCDLADFDGALAAHKDTLSGDRGKRDFATKKDAEQAYEVAAAQVMIAAHAADPKEFNRFLDFIGR